MAGPRLQTPGTGETPALPVGPADFSQTLAQCAMEWTGRGPLTRQTTWKNDSCAAAHETPASEPH